MIINADVYQWKMQRIKHDNQEYKKFISQLKYIVFVDIISLKYQNN